MLALHRLNLIAVLLGVCFSGQCVAADPSESLRKGMDSAAAEYIAENAAASTALLEVFDKQAGLVAKSTKLQSDEKDAVIAAIEAEKSDFQSHGTLPLSPVMRSSAVLYLNTLAATKEKAEKPFDKAISHYRNKAKDSVTANGVAEEKQKLLGRRLLGTWTFPGFAVPFYSDGTAGPNRSWTLDDTGLVILHRTQMAPKGCWVDKGVIELSGKACEIKNQLGHVKKGVWSNPVE